VVKLRRLLNPAFIYRNRDRIIPYLDERRDRWVNHRKLRQLQDRHLGERCFIIGNGPSLAVGDLDRLKGEITFAANKIYLIFARTEWRPHYYAVEDDHMIDQHHEEIRRLEGFVKFVPHFAKLPFRGDRDVIWYSRSLLSHAAFPKFSDNPSRHLHCGYMVTYISLQLAYFMGFTRVYLLGVDFDYSLTSPSQTVEYAAHYGHDHFTPDYFKPGELLFVPQLDRAERAMRCAKHFYEAHGRKIWNSTRGGKLQVFDRVPLEEVLDD
jgi:6-hydroxymethylpterin diphosphokinase MptE-like protein